MLSNDIIDELLPLTWEYLLLEIPLLLLRESGVADAIEDELLNISYVKVPGDIGHQIVKSNSLIAEKARVITRNWGLEALGKHVSHRMISEVSSVPKQEVTHGASFDAYIIFFNYILQVRVQEQLETMAYAFST